MHDAEGTKTDTVAADDEQAEALSRAARQAVRQPADPRLERSFAKLGLFADETPAEAPGTATVAGPPVAPPPAAPPPAAPAGAPVALPVPATPAADVDALRAEVAALRGFVEQAERRLALLTYAAAGLVVAVALLVVVLLVG